MQNILLIIFLLTAFTKLNAAQFSMSAYVYYTIDKIFTLSEDTQVWFWNNKGILTTSFGTNAKSECKGTERHTNNNITDQFFMCEGTDSQGEKIILEFNSGKGTIDAAVGNFTIVSGSGRWKEVVGVKCIGAYSQITPFEIGTFKNATAMWKGKCDVADKTLDRLINYKK